MIFHLNVFLPFLAFIINFFVWTYVVSIGKNNKLTRSTLLYLSLVMIYSILIFYLRLGQSLEDNIYLLKLIPLSYLPLGVLFLNFTYKLLRKNPDFILYIFVGIVCMSRSHLQFYVCPYNINYVWNMGFLLFLFIGIQIITGIVLSWHYCSDIQVSYYSIQYLGREVYYGWCLYYIHSSGASFIFGSLIFHVGRGLYVSSNLF